MTRYSNILDTIGNTPLVKLNRLAPEEVNVYVKVESFNPMGSVKDRMAKEIIERAEAGGELKPGQTVIEATSGNTGIGLALVCASKGYPLVVTMAESFSLERRKLLRFLGARVVLTPASEKGTGMLNKAVELAEKHGYYLCRQFENEANADVHTRTTAAEIIRDMQGEKIDYWISGFGTGGTLKGVARGLKANDDRTQIVAAEPDNSPVLGSGIPQPRDEEGNPSASHPYFRPHLMQGWSPDFISDLTESAMAEGLIDQIVPVNGNRAIELCKRLAREEGIFVGTSSGATLAAALDVAEAAAPGSNVICMLADTGERYLSTPLFADISEDMNDEEVRLSESTPGYRFASEPSCTTEPDSTPVEVDIDAKRHVEDLIDQYPVVMFALEWCEFCWATRKFFAAAGISFHSADLDSTGYQAGDLGVKCRSVLHKMTGEQTIPQIFVNGGLIGGCTELFDAHVDGRLKTMLEDAGVECDREFNDDPSEFLPRWVHPRKTAA